MNSCFGKQLDNIYQEASRSQLFCSSNFTLRNLPKGKERKCGQDTFILEHIYALVFGGLVITAKFDNSLLQKSAIKIMIICSKRNITQSLKMTIVMNV